MRVGDSYRSIVNDSLRWQIVKVGSCTVSLQGSDSRTIPHEDLDKFYRLESAPTLAGDQKAGLTGDRPKLSLVPTAPLVHCSRAMEYGAEKYERGNYHSPPPENLTPEARVMGHVDAALRHLTKITDAYNRAVGTTGDARAAIAVVDDRGEVPSNLPDLAHAVAAVGIALQCAVDAGILPADPGRPWKKPAEDLWRGYRRTDILAVVAQAGAWPYYRNWYFGSSVSCEDTGGTEIRWVIPDDFFIPACRRAGLRRPDEPDYKELSK